MSVYFNGRTLITPTTASRVDDSQLANRNLSISNVVAFIGAADGGTPKTPLAFTNPVDARVALHSGLLLDAIERAFDPSADTNAPARVIGVRVNPATESTLTLNDDADAAVIDLTSADYGLHTTDISVKIEDGSASGKRLSVMSDGRLYTADNVGRRLLSVFYGGSAASATLSITADSVALEAPTGTNVATIDLASAKTVDQLVARIANVADFEAEALDGNGSRATQEAFDYVSAVDVKTAEYDARADLQAIVDWFNSGTDGILIAARAADAGTVPANIAYTYLDGGTDGATNASDWSDALDALQGQDVRWISVLTPDSSVHAQLVAHCSYMSYVGGRERRGFCGLDVGATKDEVRDAAKALGSDRVAMVYPGHYDYDQNGEMVLRAPYMTAAVVAAGFSGLPPATSMSNKSIRVRGLEVDLRNPADTDELIPDGVLCVENTDTGYRVVQAVSTWQSNRNYNRVEISVGAGYDEVSRQLRATIDQFRGRNGSPELLITIKAAASSILDELARPVSRGGPGILVGDENNPPYQGLTISIEADVLRCDVQACVGIPINYNLITVYGVPFKGSASA